MNNQFIKAIIKDPIGFHLRPAAEIAKFIKNFQSDIILYKTNDPSKRVNLKSVMNAMTLGVKHKDEITIELIGTNSKEDMSNLKTFMEEKEIIYKDHD